MYKYYRFFDRNEEYILGGLAASWSGNSTQLIARYDQLNEFQASLTVCLFDDHLLNLTFIYQPKDRFAANNVTTVCIYNDQFIFNIVNTPHKEDDQEAISIGMTMMDKSRIDNLGKLLLLLNQKLRNITESKSLSKQELGIHAKILLENFKNLSTNALTKLETRDNTKAASILDDFIQFFNNELNHVNQYEVPSHQP